MGKKRKANDGKRADVSDVVDAMHQKRDKAAAPPATSLFRVETAPTESLNAKQRKERARSHVLHIDKVLLPDGTGQLEPLGARSSFAAQNARRDADRAAQSAAAKRKAFRAPGAQEDRRVAELAKKMQAGVIAPPSKKRKRDGPDADVLDPWAFEPLTAPLLPDNPREDSFAAAALEPWRPKKRAKPLPAAPAVAAVEPAAPGQSYLPVDEEHQRFLGAVVADEMYHERERAALDARMTDEQRKAVVRERFSHLVPFDMITVGGDDDDDDDDDGDDGNASGEGDAASGDAALSAGAARLSKSQRKKLGERKTRAQRHREFRNRMNERNRLAARFSRRLHAAVDNLKNIKKTIKEQEELRARRRAALQAMIDAKAGAPMKKIGRYKVRPPRAAFLLPEEVPSSLRTLKVDRGLIQDRLRSWEHRNLVEVMDLRKKHEPYRPEQVKRYVKEAFRGTTLEYKF